MNNSLFYVVYKNSPSIKRLCYINSNMDLPTDSLPCVFETEIIKSLLPDIGDFEIVQLMMFKSVFAVFPLINFDCFIKIDKEIPHLLYKSESFLLTDQNINEENMRVAQEKSNIEKKKEADQKMLDEIYDNVTKISKTHVLKRNNNRNECTIM